MEDSVCEEHQSPAKRPKTGSSSVQQCGSSCSSPMDCDINHSCVCASDKSVPLSSTWGTYTCTFVANAAAAIAAAAIHSGTACRGRCLLDDDGILRIPAELNTQMSNLTVTELSCPCNCTYVSKGCCLSQTDVVWEDPVEKAATIMWRPNETICCSQETGKWISAVGEMDSSSSNPMCA